LGLVAFGASTGDPLQRVLGVGAFLGLAVGAVCAGVSVRATARSMGAWMRQREVELNAWSDDRANVVTRQFDWAVEELVALRVEIRRLDGLRIRAEEVAANASERAAATEQLLEAARGRIVSGVSDEDVEQRAKLEGELREAEYRARRAEERSAELVLTLQHVVAASGARADQTVALAAPTVLDWTLQYDGTAHELRVHPTEQLVRINAVRLFGEDGTLAIESRKRRGKDIAVRIPQAIAAAVEQAHWTSFRLEALVSGEWRRARLIDRREAAGDAAESAERRHGLRVVG
jgi:hypothetical protein